MIVEYRVRPGRRFGAMKQYGPGDIVRIDVRLAGAFLDKLERIEDDPPVPAPAPAPAGWDFEKLAEYSAIINKLIKAGYETPESVQMASDEELLAVRGVGPKSLGQLRIVLGAG